jgi:hypothetical protein
MARLMQRIVMGLEDPPLREPPSWYLEARQNMLLNLNSTIHHNTMNDNKINFDILYNKTFEYCDVLDCSICLTKSAKCRFSWSPPKGVHTNESDIITDCNHQFCKSCIDNWINRNNKNSCPYCRNPLSQEKLFGIIYNI